MPWRSSIVAWRVLLKFACKLLHTLNHANQVLILCLQNYTIKAWCLICAGLQDSNVLVFSFSRNAFRSLHLHPCRMHFWQHQKVQDRGIWQTSWGKQWQQKAQPGSAGDGGHVLTQNHSIQILGWTSRWQVMQWYRETRGGRQCATRPWQASLKYPYGQWKSKRNLFWLELFINWCKLVPSNVLTCQDLSRSSSTTSPLDFFNLGASQANCIHHSYMTRLNGVGEHGKLNWGRVQVRVGHKRNILSSQEWVIALCLGEDRWCCVYSVSTTMIAADRGRRSRRLRSWRSRRRSRRLRSQSEKPQKPRSHRQRTRKIALNSQVVRWFEARSLTLFNDF